MRPSSIHALPQELRTEIDRYLTEEYLTIEDTLRRIRTYGAERGETYRISKSALGRYRRALFDGRRDLELLSVGAQPLSTTVAAAVATGDEALADLVGELIGLQVRQLGVLKQIQSRMRERAREQEAREWAQGKAHA